MPVSTGSDTRMYSPRSESNLGYANDAEDNPHGVGDPETMEQLRDKRMAEAESKQTVHDLPHLRIDVPNPDPEMPPVPDMPEEPMMDDDNENARGAEVSQMTGMPDMGNLSIGNATGTMPQPGGMLATGEPMDLAWRLLKEEDDEYYAQKLREHRAALDAKFTREQQKHLGEVSLYYNDAWKNPEKYLAMTMEEIKAKWNEGQAKVKQLEEDRARQLEARQAREEEERIKREAKAERKRLHEESRPLVNPIKARMKELEEEHGLGSIEAALDEERNRMIQAEIEERGHPKMIGSMPRDDIARIGGNWENITAEDRQRLVTLPKHFHQAAEEHQSNRDSIQDMMREGYITQNELHTPVQRILWNEVQNEGSDINTGEPMDDAWSELMKARKNLKNMGSSSVRPWKQPQYKIQPGGADISTATSRRAKLHSRHLQPHKHRGLDKAPLSVHRSHLGIATKQPLRLFPQKYGQQMGSMQRRKWQGNIPSGHPSGHAMGPETTYSPKAPKVASSAGLKISTPSGVKLRGQNMGIKNTLKSEDMAGIKEDLSLIEKKMSYMHFAQMRRLMRKVKEALADKERRLKARVSSGPGKQRESGHMEGQDKTTRPTGATESLDIPESWGAPSTMFAARGSGRIG